MTPRTPDPLEDVALLARSQHRVDVLRALSSGPTSRRTLHEETGISQPTLGRILSTFAERNWVQRRDQAYVRTPCGDLVATAFEELLETVETAHRLSEVADLLPADELTFDLSRLAAATITTPQPGDVFRHVRRVEAVLRSAPAVRIITDDILRDALEDQHRRIHDGDDPDYRLETVVTRDALDQAFADPTLVGWIRDLLASGRAPIARYDGQVPMTMAVAGETALLVPADEHGIPGAVVETDDDVVRTWVDEQFETYREQATPLSVDDLPA